MTENELIELGSAYKRACRHKLLTYQRASQIADKHLKVLILGEAQQNELESTDSLTVGVMLLCDWGADVPPELMAKAHVVPNISVPGEVEIH